MGARKSEMVKALFSLLFAFFYINVYSQSHYRISYAESSGWDFNLPTTNATWVTRSTRKDKLVFNDSMCFSYIIMNNQDLMKKKKIYGEKMIHHASFYNQNSNIYHNMVAWPAGKKNMYLIMDTLKAGTWIFLPGTKKILEYNCQTAISIYNQTDTTRVWYTTELPYSFGPRGHVGFPGLVLEVVNSRYHQIVATKIEKGDFPIALPNGIPVISSEEAIKRRLKKIGSK